MKTKKERKYKFVELLILTLNKIISYQFLLILLEGQIMNNHPKMISVYGAALLKYWEDFFQKKGFSWGDKLFWPKYLWGCYSKWED